METKIEYATLHRRLIAAIIDLVLLAIIMKPISVLIIKIVYRDDMPSPYIDQSDILGSILSINLVYMLVHLVLPILLLGIFHVFFWYKFSATPGKMLTKCVVVDSATYKKLSIPRCILRYASYAISVLTLGLGFYVIELTRTRQGLHDFMAKTVVLRRKDKPEPDTLSPQ